jgi:enamine deaminase RidA (YjgF/YER057c/UK114 family)
MNDEHRKRLAELGLELPPPPVPKWNYRAYTRTGRLLYTAGQTPKVAGTLAFRGRCGDEVDIDAGYQAARLCALNTLAVIEDAVGLEQVARVVKLNGYAASADGFVQQAEVINGASDLFTHVLGERGEHARTAIGAPWLPGNAPAEIETVIEVMS